MSNIACAIDSILIDGQYRKQFNYLDGCSSYNHSAVEGIGSLHGLFFPPPCFEYGSSLNGFNQDGKILYGSQCTNFLNVKSNEDEILIKVSPNPATEKITISGFSFSGKEVVEIYNMMGERMKLETGNWKLETELDVSSLAAGVYLVQVKDVEDPPGRKEKIYRSKIIKE